MIGTSRHVRVFVYARPADMRLGFDGLYARIRNELGVNPLSGDIFLFIGKDRRKAKAILWDGTGLLMYYKRLEKGLFAPLFEPEKCTAQLTLSELQLFFEGSMHVGRIPLSPAEFIPEIVA
ncbi:MAG: IS66 family insertion sequence element accessory protein TnpB [Myxococcota bacterium]